MMRVAIVDDEPLAREGLRRRLERDPDIEIVGEAGDGASAIAMVKHQRPDVLFLDVQMPGMDGFVTLEHVAIEHLPLLVFVTAYDAYAIRAFEVHAVDYLLKPLDDDRLTDAIRRLKREIALADAATGPERVARLLDARSKSGAQVAESGGAAGVETGATASPARPMTATAIPFGRFVVRERGQFRLVPVEAVHWVESAGNYVELHTGSAAYLVRLTLSRAEAGLAAHGFVRVHRTTLVRLDRVRSVSPTGNGDFVLKLEGGYEVQMSRRFRGPVLGR
jgi:two-component system, LytTR family, response regulator